MSTGISESRSGLIGHRVRMVRRRRGLSQDVVAGLAGITKSYLSMLENGQRGFHRRGLVEDLADALGCSVADLTGQPYVAPDRATADARGAIAEITPLLYEEAAPEDHPAQPVQQLARWAAEANAQCDEARYAQAGHHLGTLLGDLSVHVATGSVATREMALRAWVEACVVAFGVARQLGHPELAVQAMHRGHAAAVQLGDAALAGFTDLALAGAYSRLGARRAAATAVQRARSVVFDDAGAGADLRAVEALGMAHLLSAQLAGRTGRPRDAQMHLDEAGDLARRTGERNTLAWHFGPANVAAWSLAIAVEQGNGPAHAEHLDTHPVRPASAGRRSRLHVDLALGYAQAGGERDGEAIRHLDAADRIAPTRVRNDPLARDLLAELTRRARRRVWVLESLANRLQLSETGSLSVNR